MYGLTSKRNIYTTINLYWLDTSAVVFAGFWGSKTSNLGFGGFFWLLGLEDLEFRLLGLLWLLGLEDLEFRLLGLFWLLRLEDLEFRLWGLFWLLGLEDLEFRLLGLFWLLRLEDLEFRLWGLFWLLGLEDLEFRLLGLFWLLRLFNRISDLSTSSCVSRTCHRHILQSTYYTPALKKWE